MSQHDLFLILDMDSILRAEGEADVFTIRRWGEDSAEDAENEDETIIDVFDTSLSDSSL